MVEAKLNDETLKILNHIAKSENFLLSGGAGSGKTYSLVQVIKETIRMNPKDKIACMTYTNAAVKEISERVNHKNLYVSTIHDFLWENIKMFQNELKKSLLILINQDESGIKKPNDNEDAYENNFINGITYKEHLRINEGEISHDEILIIANYMYKNYKLLCDILKDKFKFIFLDEYQDTSPLVVEIFLEHIQKSKKECVIGFFGDSMQSIYDDGIGNLKKYLDMGLIKEVSKLQNRRNPMSVINLANKIRTDNLIQEPSSDISAPNMVDGKCKEGQINFLYSLENDISKIKNTSYFLNWNFSDAKKTKELNLTHNLIAPKAGFPGLMKIYDKDPIIKLKNEIMNKIKKDKLVIDENITFDQLIALVPLVNREGQLKINLIKSNPLEKLLYEQLKNLLFSQVKKIYIDKDSLIDDKKDDLEDENKKGSKRDNLIKHLFKIQSMIQLYDEAKYVEFFNKTEYKIRSIKDKQEIKDIINTIKNMSDNSIGDVIEFAHQKGLCKKDDNLMDFIINSEYLYKRVIKIKFIEFQNLYYYLEGFTPFSTQHKIKGSEYDNVFVILDNGEWNNYNFARLFGDGKGTESVLTRTQKIFYVCCTRAKENLIVFYHNPSKVVLENAKKWFGDEKVNSIDFTVNSIIK